MHTLHHLRGEVRVLAGSRSAKWAAAALLVVVATVGWRVTHPNLAHTPCKDYVLMTTAHQLEVARTVFPAENVNKKTARLLVELCHDGARVTDYNVKEATHI